MQNYYWLILMILCLVIEIITPSLTTIWFAAGALVTYVVSLTDANIVVQIVVFLVVSIVALIFTRPIALKYFNTDRKKTNVDTIIGITVKVIEKIDNGNLKGKVIINGIEWTARSVSDEVIEEGAMVVVKEVSGVKVICEQIK